MSAMLLAPADNVSVALELLNRATSKLQRLQVLSDHLPITVNHNLEEVDSERQKFTKLFKGKRYAKVVGLDANVELLGGQTAPRRRRRRRRNRSNSSMWRGNVFGKDYNKELDDAVMEKRALGRLEGGCTTSDWPWPTEHLAMAVKLRLDEIS